MGYLKKIIGLFVMACALVMVVGCENSDKTIAEKIADGETVEIGILQISTHEALDDARRGFVDALEDAGYKDNDNITITIMNPEGDDSIKVSQATSLVRDSDLVLGIATPAATALQNAANQEQIDLPILFTAVTDPVGAALVTSNEVPGANITGTNDMNPVKEQVELAKELMPEMTKMGIIYNINEDNSLVQAQLAKAAAEEQGIEVEIKTVNNSASEITPTANALISDGCQVIYVPTDNLMASNMPAIISATEPEQVVTSCGCDSMVTDGGTLSYSIDYYNLGKLTGEMAVKIIEGEDTATMAVGSLDTEDLKIVLNRQSLSTMGIIVPQSIEDRISAQN